MWVFKDFFPYNVAGPLLPSCADKTDQIVHFLRNQFNYFIRVITCFCLSHVAAKTVLSVPLISLHYQRAISSQKLKSLEIKFIHFTHSLHCVILQSPSQDHMFAVTWSTISHSRSTRSKRKIK